MGMMQRRGSGRPSFDLWDPFRLLRSGDEGTGEREGLMFVPDVEVKETGDAYLLRADLPGLTSDDVDVSITGSRLTLRGARNEEQTREDERYYAHERTYGSFMRSFLLPDGVDADHIGADIQNGVLNVRIPKRPQATARRIDVGNKGVEPEELGAKATAAKH